jgi:hypothetical protein
MKPTAPLHLYEVPPRKDKRGVAAPSSCGNSPARSGIPVFATFLLPWIRRALWFEEAYRSRQRRLYAIKTSIQMLREKNVLGGHHYQFHGDQEDAGFKQEAVAEALDDKSDDKQNERYNDN